MGEPETIGDRLADPVPGPALGPCTSWITAADVAACCKPAREAVGSDVEMLATVALEASMALFEISGRQFTGLCERVVRPCRQTCVCFGQSPAAGLGPWFWTSAFYGGGGWFWRNECGEKSGCAPLSRVRLAGYPVRVIEEVLIDGVSIPRTPGAQVVGPNGQTYFGGWRLDRWRYLTRMDNPGPPVQEQEWPSCQNMALDADQPGTFEVTYLCGVDPPELGRQAAAQIACQLWLSCNGDKCALPAGTTKVVRQNVTVERGLLMNWFDPTKPTGLTAVDLFLKAYWGTRARRRPAVFSPDLQPFAKRVGQG